MIAFAVTVIFVLLLLTGDGTLQNFLYEEPPMVFWMGLGVMGLLSLMTRERTR